MKILLDVGALQKAILQENKQNVNSQNLDSTYIQPLLTKARYWYWYSVSVFCLKVEFMQDLSLKLFSGSCK